MLSIIISKLGQLGLLESLSVSNLNQMTITIEIQIFTIDVINYIIENQPILGYIIYKTD